MRIREEKISQTPPECLVYQRQLAGLWACGKKCTLSSVSVNGSKLLISLIFLLVLSVMLRYCNSQIFNF